MKQIELILAVAALEPAHLFPITANAITNEDPAVAQKSREQLAEVIHTSQMDSVIAGSEVGEIPDAVNAVVEALASEGALFAQRFHNDGSLRGD